MQKDRSNVFWNKYGHLRNFKRNCGNSAVVVSHSFWFVIHWIFLQFLNSRNSEVSIWNFDVYWNIVFFFHFAASYIMFTKLVSKLLASRLSRKFNFELGNHLSFCIIKLFSTSLSSLAFVVISCFVTAGFVNSSFLTEPERGLLYYLCLCSYTIFCCCQQLLLLCSCKSVHNITYARNYHPIKERKAFIDV